MMELSRETLLLDGSAVTVDISMRVLMLLQYVHVVPIHRHSYFERINCKLLIFRFTKHLHNSVKNLKLGIYSPTAQSGSFLIFAAAIKCSEDVI